MIRNSRPVWIMLFFVFFFDIIGVNHYIQFFIFAYSNNSASHNFPAAMPSGKNNTPSRICCLLSSLVLSANLVNFFCEQIVYFTTKPLLQLQYCFIVLQTVFEVYKFNFAFYYASLSDFCFFFFEYTRYLCIFGLTNSFIILPPNSLIISSITFLLLPMGSGLSNVSNFVSTSSAKSL